MRGTTLLAANSRGRANDEESAIRIVVATPLTQLRQRLRKLLDAEPLVRLLGESANLSETQRLIARLAPDVVLIDLNSYRTFEGSLIFSHSARIVVVLEKTERADLVEAFLRGAQAVVLQNVAPEALLASLRSVKNGQYWLENETIGVLVEALREMSPKSQRARSPKDYGLTQREVDIISKIANGWSNKEVSKELSISERTVKHHLTNIFDKVGVSSRLELALLAVNRRWMEESSSAAAS